MLKMSTGILNRSLYTNRVAWRWRWSKNLFVKFTTRRVQACLNVIYLVHNRLAIARVFFFYLLYDFELHFAFARVYPKRDIFNDKSRIIIYLLS